MLPFGQVAEGDLHLLIGMLAVGRPEHGETAGFANRQRVEQHGRDSGEHAGVRTDADREREHQRRGKRGAPQQKPETVLEIVEKARHWKIKTAMLASVVTLSPVAFCVD